MGYEVLVDILPRRHVFGSTKTALTLRPNVAMCCSRQGASRQVPSMEGHTGSAVTYGPQSSAWLRVMLETFGMHTATHAVWPGQYIGSPSALRPYIAGGGGCRRPKNGTLTGDGGSNAGEKRMRLGRHTPEV